MKINVSQAYKGFRAFRYYYLKKLLGKSKHFALSLPYLLTTKNNFMKKSFRVSLVNFMICFKASRKNGVKLYYNVYNSAFHFHGVNCF